MWRNLWHRLHNLLARTFLVFVIATVLLLIHAISEQTWLYISLTFIFMEKVKDTFISIKRER